MHTENCTQYKIVRGDPHCPDKPWTDCSHACIKSRQAVPRTEPLYVGGKCNYQLQTSTCYAGACPLHDGDYLLYLDMRVRVEPWKWSYVYTESFYAAMTSLFKVTLCLSFCLSGWLAVCLASCLTEGAKWAKWLITL